MAQPSDRDAVNRERLALDFHIKYISHSTFLSAQHVFGCPSFDLLTTRGTLFFDGLATRMVNWIHPKLSRRAKNYLRNFDTVNPRLVNSNIAVAIGCAITAYLMASVGDCFDWIHDGVPACVTTAAAHIYLGFKVDENIAQHFISLEIRQRIYLANPMINRIRELAEYTWTDPEAVFHETLRDDPRKNLCVNYWCPLFATPVPGIEYVI